MCLVVSLTARRAAAQAPAAPQPTTGFQDGFFIQSPDGDNRLVFGFVGQLDGRFALDDPLPIVNSFTIRKFRPTFSGRVGRYFEFKMMPDFGGGQAVVADAFLDVRFSPSFRVRTGKDKVPFGHELLQGDAFVLFPERSLASGLVPNRDLGVQAIGDLWRGHVSYSAGVFNGIPDGTSSAGDVDTNSAKDLAGRVTVQPFRTTGQPPRALTGLGLHLGATRGTEAGALPSFKTSAGQTYFSYGAGAVASGTRTRVTPAVFYYYKGFGGFAEYVRSTQAVSRGLEARDLANHAWEVTGSWVLTGEAASDRGVRPRRPFDPEKGQWGAVQVLARYTALRVDSDAFTSGLAAPGASQEARSWTIGLNWYPNPWTKWYATFERTEFDEGNAPARPAEDVVLVRFQLAF